jgi:transmembrane sensor
MEKEQVLALLERYHQGNCTAQEKAAVEAWYNSYAAEHIEELIEEDLDQERIIIWNQIQGSKQKPATLRLQVMRYAVAAILALMAIGAGWFYFGHSNDKDLLMAGAADVAPAKSGATLTLANGKQIRLTDVTNGELAEEAGVRITKTSGGEIIYELKGKDAGKNKTNTLSTGKGETYQLQLPDGTRVWLNAATSLTYANVLTTGGKRSVELNGEAYFEVAKDKAHPFVVKSAGQQVDVLGTHFNVNSYADAAATQTTLLEGSVRVSAKTGEAATLKPGQQSLVVYKRPITVKTVDLSEAMAWKDGYFRFYEVDLETFMRTISRWYDIDVIFEGGIAQYKDLAFGGAVSRSKNISEVLKILAQTGKVSYRIEGRKVTISKE